MRYRQFTFLLLAVLAFSYVSFAVNDTARSQRQPLLDFNSLAPASATRNAVFVPIAQSDSEAACRTFHPPRLITVVGNSFYSAENNVAVDVIVGKDGSVENLIILQDSESAAEKKIEEQVRRWVYKPALCDGFPVEAEGRVEVRAR
jgi:hypothetical protein